MKKSRPAKAKGAQASGNPAARAAAEQRRRMQALFSLNPEATAWWPASAVDVLAASEALLAVGGIIELENTAARILGAELALRLEHEQYGQDPHRWLEAVVDHAVARLRETGSAAGWLLLHAIAAIDAGDAAKKARSALKGSRAHPTSKDLAARFPWTANASPAHPTGDTLAAVDGYGCRYLLTAPFQVPGEPATAHWYAWDVDLCSTQRVVAAGVFDNAENALAEWRSAVGDAATETRTLAPVTEPVTIRKLLDDCLSPGPLHVSFTGDEPVALLNEYFRMRGRAVALSRSLPGASAGLPAAVGRNDEVVALTGSLVAEFSAWHHERPDSKDGRGTVDLDEEAASTLIYEWLTSGPDIARFGCSPHRVRHLTLFLRDFYEDDHAAKACALLPSWVAWCAEKTRLTPTLADRALAEAHRSVSTRTSERDLDESPVARVTE